VIPAKANRRNPAPHDRVKYRWRNRIERLFNKLKNWRRVATRYDETAESYIGFVSLASSIALAALCPRGLVRRRLNQTIGTTARQAFSTQSEQSRPFTRP